MITEEDLFCAACQAWKVHLPPSGTRGCAGNGKGIPPADLDDAKSLGLLGMKERAESVGGAVTFQAGPPRGTLVKLALPLPDPVPALSPSCS